MATSLMGPLVVCRALAAAPVPRPPQPTRATRIVLFSPAWTSGTAVCEKAVAAATMPPVFRKSRREGEVWGSVMVDSSTGWRDRGDTRGPGREAVEDERDTAACRLA